MRSLIAAIVITIIALPLPFVPEAAALTPTQAASSSRFAELPHCRNLVALIYARRRNRQGFVPPCDPRFLFKRQPINRTSSSASSSSVRSSVSSSSSSAAASSSASSVSIAPAFYDQQDTTIRSQFLLLGEVGPVIGSAKAFLYEEPLDVTEITINLTSDVAATVNALQVFRDDKGYLGRATLTAMSTTTRTFHLTLPSGSFLIDKATERGIYVRPDIRSREGGGISDTTIQIADVSLKGHGYWSNQEYTKTSSDTFPRFVTARSVIKRVLNASEANGALVTGDNRTIAAFQFEGISRDPASRLALKSLSFTIEQTGGVRLTNVRLMVPGMSDQLYCTTGTERVECDSLPDSYGSLSDGTRNLLVIADVFAVDPLHASLRLTLNEAGSPLSLGSIRWSDGTATFTWVPFDMPVASGTMWRY